MRSRKKAAAAALTMIGALSATMLALDVPVRNIGYSAGKPMITASLAAAETQPGYVSLPGAGKRIDIGQGYSFVYAFDKKPQMGTVILKVQLFDASGMQSTAVDISAEYGMPSMRGAHDSGPQLFRLNKKGDYLLPLTIVMPGVWEVKLDFLKDKKGIYHGSFTFTV
jgi:hypothetical protein